MNDKKKYTERQLQEDTAKHMDINGNSNVYEFTYKCIDKVEFKVIACREAGAFRVLDAERPGMTATLVNKRELSWSVFSKEWMDR